MGRPVTTRTADTVSLSISSDSFRIGAQVFMRSLGLYKRTTAMGDRGIVGRIDAERKN